MNKKLTVTSEKSHIQVAMQCVEDKFVEHSALPKFKVFGESQKNILSLKRAKASFCQYLTLTYQYNSRYYLSFAEE